MPSATAATQWKRQTPPRNQIMMMVDSNLVTQVLTLETISSATFRVASITMRTQAYHKTTTHNNSRQIISANSIRTKIHSQTMDWTMRITMQQTSLRRTKMMVACLTSCEA